MSKTLIIAEKPSVAADYAKILGCNNKYHGYFEGENYIATYALGHLFTLKKPDEYNDKYKAWNIEDLPIIPDVFRTSILESSKSQFFIIKSLIERQDVSMIINGGDCGTEGELIQRWILQNIKTKKPVKRLWINDLTEKEIKRGLSCLKDSKEYDQYYYAAFTRAKIDWILGMNYSRAYTILLGGKGVTLSIGRCQTPILNLIVQRDLQIENFKPEDYFEVMADLGSYKAKFIDVSHDNNSRILNKAVADSISQKIQGKKGIVRKVKVEDKFKQPPMLFNLTDLQKVMSNKYSFTEDKTLKLTQKLYEEYKILSYPRTSSNHLSDNIAEEFNDYFSNLNFGNYAGIVKGIVPENIKAAANNKRFVDNSKITDHYAIIPTNNHKIKDIYNTLAADEKLLFDEVVLRFLSIFIDNYEYQTTSILTDIEGFPFLSRVIMVSNLGWKSVYKDDEEDLEEDSISCKVSEGNVFNVMGSEVMQGKTKAPAFYTTSSLLSAMQKYNIGTEATRTAIIHTLIQRGFITRNGIKFKSTDLGKNLIHSVNIDEVKSVELTSVLENKINLILDKKINYDDVFSDSVSILKNNLNLIKSSKFDKINKSDLGICPVCKEGHILKFKNFYGCSNYKNGCKFSINDHICGASISEVQVNKLLSKGKTDLLSFTYKDNKFKAKLYFDDKSKRVEFLKNSGKK